MDVKPEVDIPTQASEVPTQADDPNKQETYSMGSWGRSKFNETQKQREISCFMAKDKVKILSFLAKPELPVYSMINTQGWTKLVSKLKNQETGVPNKDIVPPQQAVKRMRCLKLKSLNSLWK